MRKIIKNNKRHKEKNIVKKQTGITLIALVITIIVLLILAGVSIAMLTGQNGILTQAQSAKTSTANKSAEEKVKLAVMAARSQSETGALEADKLVTEVTTNYGGQAETTAGGFPVTVTIDGKSFTVDENGTVELSGAKPQMTNVKIATDAKGTTAATNNTPEGTTLYITFGASIEGGTISKVIDDAGNQEMTANNGIYSKAVTENGKYTFTIKGIVDGEEKESKSLQVTVKEFESKIKPGTQISLTSTSGTTEEFYVLSYDESTQKAKALAKYNLKVGNIYNNNSNTAIATDSAGYGLQNSEMKGWVSSGQPYNGVLAFSSSWYFKDTFANYPVGKDGKSYVYDSNSNLYQYVEAYKTKLGNTDKVSEVSLPSYEDINALWSNKSKYTWLYSTSYWTGSADGASSSTLWSVDSDGYFTNDSCGLAHNYGVRPVITIDMSKI